MSATRVALVFVLGAASLSAQEPRITNAQLTVEPAGSPFVASFQALAGSQSDVMWIGYAVPAPPREGTNCCFSSGTSSVSGTVVVSSGARWTSGCQIEPATDGRMAASPAPPLPPGPVKLEGPDRAVVMFRIATRQVDRIRVFSEGCDLDAGGRPVRWLENVRPAESVALLDSLTAGGERRDRTVDGALAALAMHAAPEATAALIRQARGHRIPAVRGEAIFWLGQKAGAQAASEITARVYEDPDTEVKRRAVFALSQLPRDEGVPLLIRVARTHENPAVRKQAFFWLGQSKDARAVEFFAEILAR